MTGKKGSLRFLVLGGQRNIGKHKARWQQVGDQQRKREGNELHNTRHKARDVITDLLGGVTRGGWNLVVGDQPKWKTPPFAPPPV